MTMLAQSVLINRAENGWILTVYSGGNSIALVAKEIGEIAGFLKGMEWQTPRPLPASDHDVPVSTQSLSGGSYR